MNGHRQLYRCQLCVDTPLQLPPELLSAIENEQALWVGGDGSHGIPAKQYRQHLGKTYGWLIFDTRYGFQPDAFAALSGTVIGGGVILMITPPVWAVFNDPDYARFVSYGVKLSEKSLYLQRVEKSLGGFPTVEVDALPELLGSVQIMPQLNALELTGEQKVVLELLESDKKIIKVVTADRGRGKSTVVGVFAAQQSQLGKRVVVTAPNKPQATVLMNAAKRCGETLSFVPPDVLIHQHHDLDWLIVDEAAALPVPVLFQLLEKFDRVVFSTTIHGYEGSGRGFGLRFLQKIDGKVESYLRCDLHEPIRWSANDPVEKWLNEVFLLDVEPFEAESSVVVEEIDFQWVEKAVLVENEALLRAIYSVSLAAHYQTHPSDLRLLLDHPGLNLLVGFYQQKPIVVVWVVNEGPLPNELHLGIQNGERRVAGHLIPQLLAFQDNASLLLSHKTGRITRIAVHPNYQGKGVGSAALNALESLPRPVDWDYLGSSFGATTDLVRFWQRAGYQACRLGVKADAASGANSMVVMKSLKAKNAPLVEALNQRATRQFAALKRRCFQWLDEGLATCLGEAKGQEPNMAEELQAFTLGKRQAESVAWSLYCLAKQSNDVLLNDYALNNLSWKALAVKYALAGRRGVENQLRQQVAAAIRKA